MSIRSWLWGCLVGSIAGLVVAVPVTIADWRLNPSGLFHNAQGTNWGVVTETALSWFWPVALIAFILTVVVQSLIARVRSR